MTAPTAQDHINALEQQRNDALNTCVNLTAELIAAKREVDRVTALLDAEKAK